MKRYRVNFLTGLIAGGLLLLNLGGLVFSYAADSPVACSANSVPVDGDDTDDGGRAVSPLTAAGWNEHIPTRQERRVADGAPYQFSFRPPFAPRRSTLPSHLVERAAAVPRAPSSLA